MKRAGFTIIELIVATVVMAILGTALIQILVRDSRFVSQVESLMNARQGARAAMTLLTAELGMVSDSGMLAATNKSVTVRVPFSFGMSCQTQGNRLFASMAPTDSLMEASATPTGVAWQDTTGTYQFVTGIAVQTVGNRTRCTRDSIRIVTGGRVARIRKNGISIPSGRFLYLFQNITYSFEASTTMPGRIGLFRTDGSSTKEELLAPFDTSAGFGFLTGPNLTASSTVPGDLNTVRGLQLILPGESYQNPQGRDEPAEFNITTSVAFRNQGG